MTRVLLAILASLALCACATTGTIRQTMYQVYGSYDAALEGFADYAEGPTADPAFVSRIRAVVTSEPVVAAVTYGRAYVNCDGKNTVVIVGTNCALFNFSDASARGYATTLRSVLVQLRNR